MVSLMSFALAGLGIAAGLLYIFLVWNFDYWKRRGVKGMRPAALYGSFPNMITSKRNIVYDMQDIYKHFQDDEDFVGVFSIRTPQLMITNAKLAKDIFVKYFRNFHDNEISTWFDTKKTMVLAMDPFVLQGDEWKKRRQEIATGLTSKKIKAMYPVTQQVCGKLISYIRQKSQRVDCDGIDIKDISLRYTCDIVTDFVMGINSQCLTDKPTQILQIITNLFQQATLLVFYSCLAGLWPAIKDFYKARFCDKQTESMFVDLMMSAINSRRRKNVQRADFLNYILQLRKKSHLSDEQLASHSMTVLMDGFDTTACVITHCLYQEKLFKEILGNLDEKDGLDYEQLNELPYLDQCVNESIRITPPAPFATKVCTEECQLTNKKGKTLKINRNDIVLIPVFCIHHDERYYPSPNEFIPERFSHANGGVRKFRELGVFYPFGDGPRICPGARFAMTQTKAAIVEIVKTFHLKLDPKSRTDNLMHPNYLTGSLDNGIWLNFDSRK